MSVAVNVTHVTKCFGATRALDDVSIPFAAGRIHGLIGSEGAGKTTLMRVIMRLYTCDSGDILWSEAEAPLDFWDFREKISYMPGAQSLYPDLSIREHLVFFSELYQLSKEDFAQQKERLLKITRLEKFIDRRAGQLSGGMYKKLGLMCALLQHPKVLLLDEPTNGVDPISRREFWDLLYDLVAENITIIISTAYMDEAERCHEAHLLDSGKHLESGAPRQLLEAAGVKTFDEYYLKRGAGT